MNKVILLGRHTKDPELRYSTNSNNTAVCRFTLAVDRRFQKQGEEKQVDYINCVAFGKTGEFVSKYFSKGVRTAVVGSMQNRSWDDTEGKKHYATDVIVEEVDFADGKRSEGNYNPDSEPAGDEGFYPMDEETLPF